MNADESIARVRFRRTILPSLRAENPSLDDALVRLAASAREWLGVIDELAAPYARFPLDCRSLASVDPAIRKRGYALALEAAGLGYDATHLEQIDALVCREPSGEVGVDVPGGRVVRSYDAVDIVRPDHRGSADLPVDEPEAADEYETRIWRAGDRMKPARLKGRSRKLSDLYIDAKVPRSVRASARVVVRVADRAIVWAEHVGFAHGESASTIPVPRRTGGTF